MPSILNLKYAFYYNIRIENFNTVFAALDLIQYLMFKSVQRSYRACNHRASSTLVNARLLYIEFFTSTQEMLKVFLESLQAYFEIVFKVVIRTCSILLLCSCYYSKTISVILWWLELLLLDY